MGSDSARYWAAKCEEGVPLTLESLMGWAMDTGRMPQGDWVAYRGRGKPGEGTAEMIGTNMPATPPEET